MNRTFLQKSVIEERLFWFSEQFNALHFRDVFKAIFYKRSGFLHSFSYLTNIIVVFKFDQMRIDKRVFNPFMTQQPFKSTVLFNVFKRLT